MAKIGYVRVSTADQNTDRQEVALQERGVERIFLEKVSGKNTDRLELKKMIEYVREGDILYIESISRLARSTRDLLKIVQNLTEKGVGLVSLKESIDTTTPQGKFVLTVFGALAELERESTLQRQQEGISIARQKGKRFGRPKKIIPANFAVVVGIWKNGEITAVEAMKRLNLKPSTFYKKVRDMEGNHIEKF